MSKYGNKQLLVCAVLLVFVVAGCAPMNEVLPTPTVETAKIGEGVFVRDESVPELPFDDNPDPSACGIPVNWGSDEPAWLTGYYEGDLIQPIVFLYDSHLRLSIKGQASTGSEVRVILYQQNPTLDYYLVETVDTERKQEGWVPAPFLTFEKPES